MKKEEKRGRPITCRYCGHKFKISNSKRQRWVKLEFICPKCKTNFCFLTAIEKDLQILQTQYKRKKEEKYLNQIFRLLTIYAESIIKRYFINHIRDKSLLNYYAQSAASLLIESDYYKKTDFFIEISFGSRLIDKCKQAILSAKESPEQFIDADSLDFLFEDGHVVSYEDKSKSFLDSIEEDEEKFILCQRVCDLMFGMEDFCISPRENYIRLLNIYNYLEGGERAIDNFFKVYGRFGKFITMDSLKLLRSELQKLDKI